VDIRRFGLRLRVGTQLLLTLIATAVGIGLIVMIHDAVTSRSVVIDPVEIAPNLADEVPSGKIVAAGLLDVLTRIQAATRSSAASRTLSNAWTGDIAIEVPETGVSFGQVERLLKARFGHDQHIDGDLVRPESGVLAFTVRGTGIVPKTFSADARHLSQLETEAAEYVYGQSQPGLWAAYLANNDRNDEAIHFAQGAYAQVDLSERPSLLKYWGNAIAAKGGAGALREALSLYRESVRLKPDYWNGYNSIMYALGGLGDEEGIIAVGEQMMKAAGGRPGRAAEIFYQNYDVTVWDLAAVHASSIADMESHGGIGTAGAASGAQNLNVAQLDVLLHDGEAGALRLKTSSVDPKNLSDVSLAAMDRALLAEDSVDLNMAAKEWDAFAVAYADPSVSTSNPQYICFAAVTYQKTDQPAKADAALTPYGNLPSVDCYRFRGDVLDLRGDWAGAQAWYAKAVKLGPSIPSGYYSWGMALARHGELDEAAAKFKDANQKGPHWADPLKGWGDVLVKQGKTAEALAKYDEALKYAPNWKALQQAREALPK
jgi:tetratricopeptide (TPR) repeat protein